MDVNNIYKLMKKSLSSNINLKYYNYLDDDQYLDDARDDTYGGYGYYGGNGGGNYHGYGYYDYGYYYNHNYGSYKYINYMYSVQYSYSYSNFGSYSYIYDTKNNIDKISNGIPSMPSKVNPHHIHKPTFINAWCSKLFPCELSNIRTILSILFFLYCFVMIPAKNFNFWRKKSVQLSSKYNIILNSCYMVVLISTIILSYYTFVISYDKCMSNAVDRISRFIWISLVSTNVIMNTENINIILFCLLVLKVIVDMTSIIYKLQADADMQNQQSNYYYHFSDDNYILVTEIIEFIAWTLILNIFYFSSNMYVSEETLNSLAEHLRPKKKMKNKVQYEQLQTSEVEDEEMKFTIEDQDDDNNIELKRIKIDEGIDSSELDEIQNFIGSEVKVSNQLKCNSYEDASMCSRLYFIFVYSVLRKGFEEKKLEKEDLGTLADIDTPKHNFLLLLESLQKRAKSDSKESLMLLLFKLHRNDILACGILTLISISGAVGSIFCLNMLLKELENRPYVNWNTKYFYCFLLLLGKMIESSFEHQFWMEGLKVSGRMQNSLIAMCTYKAFRLSGSSRLVFDAGKINTLITTDTKKLSELFVVCLMHWGSWCAIGTFIVIVFGLYRVVGSSSFIVLLIIFISMPFSFFISKYQKINSKNVQDHRDRRSKYMGEAVKEIRYIKAFNCESFINSLLSSYRQSELNAVMKYQVFYMLYYIIAEITVAVSPVAVLAYYTLIQKGDLSSAAVFTTLAWCSYLTRSVKAVPNLVATLYETSASLSRIDELINAQERSSEKDWLPHLKTQKKLDENFECAKFGAGSAISGTENAQVCLKNASFSWSLNNRQSDPSYNLKDINFSFTRGQLVFVIGQVGSGKSTLLLSILGETNSSSNTIVDVKGMTSYVSDKPWVSANKSIKDNILMGKHCDEEWYEKCLNACSLIQDLKDIPGGDRSIIGDRGINLSGGQKQRINLCRAIYAKPDVILLDDVFSALDNVTGQHIFDSCFAKSGILSQSIKVIATHQYNFLYNNDSSYNLVLKDGSIVSRGTIDEVLKSNDSYVIDLIKSRTDDKPRTLNKASNSIAEIQKLINSGNASKINDETKEIGAVKLKHIKNYLKGWGSIFVFLIIFVVVFEQITNLSISFKYSYITDKCDSRQGCSMSYKKKATYTLFAMVGFLIALKITRVVAFVTGCYQASKKFEKDMRDSLFAAKISWFDKELTGRIVNRAVSDVTNIDQRMPDVMLNVLQYSLSFFTVIFLMILELPLALLSFIVTPIYYRIYQFYRFPARDLKRLNSISISPVISQLNECIGGITTIRAFGLQLHMLREHLVFLEDSAKCYMYQWFANQWVTVVIELLGCLLSSSITFSAVYYTLNKKISPSTASLMISYANAIPSTLGLLLKYFCSAEIESIAVERVSQYIELPPEEKITAKKITDYSPRYGNNYGKGEIKLINFTLKYLNTSDTISPLNESQHAVLKNINLYIRPGQKICLCGRTGAGKSSLFNALFRFYEYDGSIKVDDFELKELQLTAVRSFFALIPQDALLLGLTLRSALTCGIHIEDEEILSVLEKLQIREKIEKRGGLDMELIVGESQFSAGEKQILCAARAFLRKAPVLLCDEVASTLDQNADDIINSIILSDKNVTVLSIMHRLQNCSRYDRIIVLNYGEVAEDGTYEELILKKGIFYDMINVQK